MEKSHRPRLNEETQQNDEKTIRYAFCPIYVILKIVCLHTNLMSRRQKKNTKIETAGNIIHAVYCMVIILWMLLNTFRQVYQLQAVSKFGVSSSLASSIAIVLLCASFTLYVPLSLWKLSRNVDTLVTKIQLFVNRTGTEINGIYCRHIAGALMIGYIGITLSTFIVFTLVQSEQSSNTTLSLLEVFETFEMFGSDAPTWLNLFTWNLVQSSLNCGVTTALTAVFIFFAYLLMKSVKCLMENINKTMIQGMTDSLLRKYREEYESLVEVVQQYNSCVNFYSGTIYVLGLIVPCLMLYGIAHDRLSNDDLAYSISFILFVGMNLLVCTGISISLNSAMHKPLDSLYRINTESLSEKGVQELSLFISRLSGSPIGVSVYGLFVIDTSTVLMLIGTLAIYAVVVLQLQPSVTTSDA